MRPSKTPSPEFRKPIVATAAAVGVTLLGLLGAGVGAAHAQTDAAAALTLTYYGVYLKGGKLGYATIARDDHALYNGRPAVETVMRMVMNIVVMGSTNQIVTSNTSWADPKTGAPVAEVDVTESGDHKTTVSAVYTDDAVSYVADLNGAKHADRIPLPPGKHFLADPTNGSTVKLAVNLRASGEVFVPESFKLVDSEIDVVDQVPLDIEDKKVSAFKILDHNPMEDSIIYADANGDLLRIDNSVAGVPMVMRKEAKQIAMAPAEGATAMPDLISLTQNRPTGESLNHARDARVITYHLGGVTHPLPKSDSVESVTLLPNAPISADTLAQTDEVVIHANPLPDRSTAPPLYASASAAPASLQPYLTSTYYVDCDGALFHDLAHKILGDDPTDCVTAAEKISDYVHHTVTPDASSPAMRSASDVLHEPKGVCRDYTVLYAAIARAAGLPTKQCFGVAYAEGAFVGHAWPEVWVGKNADGTDHWVAVEPTWGKPYADATHLKLAEGDITDFFTVASDLTKYKIDVVKVE